MRKGVNDYDQQILLRPEIGAAFGDSAPNASPTAPTDSSATLNSSIGVGLSTSQRSNGRSTCGKGLDDKLVPDPINKAVADAMPGSVWHSVEGAGHFVAVGAGDDIFAIAAEELGAP